MAFRHLNWACVYLGDLPNIVEQGVCGALHWLEQSRERYARVLYCSGGCALLPLQGGGRRVLLLHAHQSQERR
jgi:hypothetical protein